MHGPNEPWIPMHRVPGVPQPVLVGGKSVKDFVWTWYSQCLIQDRVLTMFREQGFTGFQVHPVSAKWKKRPVPRTEQVPEIPTLWELIPTGWGGVAHPESGIRLTEHRGGQASAIYTKFTNPARLVDEDQWDGSDFFIVWPVPAYVFVTDRVAAFTKSQGLKGSVLIRADKLEPGEPRDTLMPGTLGLYLPEPRAREIGEPLGIY